jgi:hypothetical protein
MTDEVSRRCDEPCHHPGHRRSYHRDNHGKGSNTHVDAQCADDAWQLDWGERHQRFETPPRDQQCHRASSGTKRKGFAHRVTDESSTFGAECDPDGQLRASLFTAHQQQIGQVGTGNEQQQDDGTEQQQHR